MSEVNEPNLNEINETGEPKPNPFKTFWANQTARCSVILSGIFIITAVLLGVVNWLTVPVAQDAAAEIVETAKDELFPSAISFERANSPSASFDGEDYTIQFIYAAFDDEHETLGYVVFITAHIGGDDIDMAIGILDDDGWFWGEDSILRIGRVKILSMSDTAGLATGAQVEEFVLQFARLINNVELIGVGEPEFNEVLAIPGAPDTSEIITNTVNFALSTVQIIVDDEILTRAQAEEIFEYIAEQTEYQLEDFINGDEADPQGGED